MALQRTISHIHLKGSPELWTLGPHFSVTQSVRKASTRQCAAAELPLKKKILSTQIFTSIDLRYKCFASDCFSGKLAATVDMR